MAIKVLILPKWRFKTSIFVFLQLLLESWKETFKVLYQMLRLETHFRKPLVTGLVRFV